MENNIRINIRDPSQHYIFSALSNDCDCNFCLQNLNHQRDIFENMVQIQLVYNEPQIRMNELLASLNFNNFSYDYSAYDNAQENFINQLFQTAFSSEELVRNEKITIDVNSKKFADTGKTFTNCSICSDDYKDDDIVSTLDCNHIFHKNCIEEWGHYNPVCPVCKSNIKTKN